MGRWTAALLLALALGGCVRQEFDLCLETPPHPDCVDAGEADAGPDAD